MSYKSRERKKELEKKKKHKKNPEQTKNHEQKTRRIRFEQWLVKGRASAWHLSPLSECKHALARRALRHLEKKGRPMRQVAKIKADEESDPSEVLMLTHWALRTDEAQWLPKHGRKQQRSCGPRPAEPGGHPECGCAGRRCPAACA